MVSEWKAAEDKQLMAILWNQSELWLSIGVTSAIFDSILECCKEQNLTYIQIAITLNFWKSRNKKYEAIFFFPPDGEDRAYGYVDIFQWQTKPTYLSQKDRRFSWSDELPRSPETKVIDEGVISSISELKEFAKYLLLLTAAILGILLLALLLRR